ncbi:hypothetical protein D3C80_2042990 [compost metagenome]
MVLPRVLRAVEQRQGLVFRQGSHTLPFVLMLRQLLQIGLAKSGEINGFAVKGFA